MQQDFENKFKGIMVIKDDNDFNPENYFSLYDYWELYDENKNYTKNKFLEKFLDIPYYYHYYLLICDNINYDNTKYYVFVKREPSFLAKWEHLCDCPHCINMNIKKWISCRICSGCLKSGPLFYSKERFLRIKESQNKMIQKNFNIENINNDDIEWIISEEKNKNKE